jgi:alpha-tubulin suppressor-like RCC1 family protein
MSANLRKNTWSLNENYAEVEAGEIGYKDEGAAFELWTWGNNEYGALGQNNRTNYSSPVQIPGTIWSQNCTAASHPASRPHVFAVKTDGTLWTWGYSNYGGLGMNEPSNKTYSSPVQIPGTNWSTTRGTLIGQPYGGGAAIKTDGTLWIWGINRYGTLGLNDRISRSSPTQIPGTSWKQVTSGQQEEYQGLKTDGTLWSWGLANLGLNQPGNNLKSSPNQIPGTSWASVYSDVDSNAHFATKTDGTLWYWGEYKSGASGQGVPSARFTSLFGSDVSSPIQIPGTTWSDDVSHLSCHTQGVLAIKTDGTLWSWGENSRGRLGLSDRYAEPSASPRQVGSDNNWDSVAMGQYHASATKNDGTLWSWGLNSEGQLGHNTADGTSYSSPVQVPATGFGWGKLGRLGSQSSMRAFKTVND